MTEEDKNAIRNRIQKRLSEAQDAFFDVYVNEFPEITTGDFPPDATFIFADACRDAVFTWVEGNLPGFWSAEDV